MANEANIQISLDVSKFQAEAKKAKKATEELKEKILDLTNDTRASNSDRAVSGIVRQFANLKASISATDSQVDKLVEKLTLQGKGKLLTDEDTGLPQLIAKLREAETEYNNFQSSTTEAERLTKSLKASHESMTTSMLTNLSKAQAGMKALNSAYYENLAKNKGLELSSNDQQILAMTDKINAENRASEQMAKANANLIETKTRNEKSILNALERELESIETASMTMSEKLSYRIKKLGLDESTFSTQMSQLKAWETKQKELTSAQALGTNQMNEYGLTAKQMSAAMRGMPAQLTDIAVSLQGGQRPLTVLLQQGGQIKDMFGGVVPAIKAFTVAVLDMINPITVGITAAGGLAYAISEGASESGKLGQELTKTGNYAGMTVAELQNLAKQTSEVSGTYTQAREAISAMAATGTMNAQEIKQAMEGVDAAVKVTGQSVDEVVKTFAKLAEKPTETLYDLNRQYNFLTAEVYKEVSALEKQGRTQEAVELAQKTYNDAMIARMKEQEKYLGIVERAWRSVKEAVLDVWEAIKNFGRAQDEALKVAEKRATLESVRANYQGDDRAERIADAEYGLKLALEEQAAAKATAETRSKAAREEKNAIEEIRRSEKVSSGSGRSGRSSGGSAGQSRYAQLNSSITQQIEQLKLQTMQETALTNAEKLRIQVEFEATNGKVKLTAAEKANLNTKLNELEALETEVKQKKFIADYEKNYKKSVDDSVRAIESQIETLGMGTEKATLYKQKQEDIAAAYRTIEEAKKNGSYTDGFDTKILEDVEKKYDAIAEAQNKLKDEQNNPWKALQSSLEDYTEGARNLGELYKTTFQDAFQGMEDAFVKFATTGKLSFKDMANSIIEDMARIYAKQAATGILQWISGIAMSYFTGGTNTSSATASTSSGSGLRTDSFASNLMASYQMKASGGPVSAGSTYIVGEEGPELFVPSTSGRIIPNDDLSSASGGSILSAGNINVTVTCKNEGTQKQVTSSSAQMSGKDLVISIVTKDIESDGQISRSIARNFGTRRTA